MKNLTVSILLCCTFLQHNNDQYKREKLVGTNKLSNFSHRSLHYSQSDTSSSLLGIIGLDGLTDPSRKGEIDTIRAFDLGGGIRHGVNVYLQEAPNSRTNQPYLIFHGYFIYLDSLTQTNCVTAENIGNVPHLEFTDEYKLGFGGRQYEIFRARYVLPCMNCNPHYWFLFEVTGGKLAQVFSFYDDNEYLFEHAFGDFDSDGHLDYIEETWKSEKLGRINFYSLKSEGFRKNKKYFIDLISGKEYPKIKKYRWFLKPF
jgi:hypothetical protein